MSRRTLESAAADHRAEVAAVGETLGEVPEDAWGLPLGHGKWSAAQVAQHLTVLYTPLVSELSGGPSIGLRFPAWKRFAARKIFLPRILRGNWYPRGMESPPEAHPAPPFPSRSDAPRRLNEAAAGFERAICAAHATGRGRVTHPYLGKLTAPDALRFLAMHARHHRRQLNHRIGVRSGVSPSATAMAEKETSRAGQGERR